jgi:hypothetical protein
MKLHTALALAVFSFAQAVSAATLTNESVVKMVGAGLDEDTIILAINKGDNNFDTSANGLLALKNSMVSDKIIKAMLNPKATVESSAPAAKPQSVVNITLPPTIAPEAGSEYYTRYTLRYEREAYSTTNYAKGMILPINSRVKLISLSAKSMKLVIVGTGETISVKNEKGYTGKDLIGIAALMLASEPTKIEEYPADIEKAINAGELRLGMTKQQAILTRGVPPVHKTPSTENCDSWIYWTNRFAYVTIVFRDGILVEGRGLR